jgi:hypothetical protein
MLVLNSAMAFSLEVAMLVALARLGYVSGPSHGVGWALAASAVIATALLWGYFAAPKSAHRLAGVSLLAFKTAMFTSGIGATALTASAWLAAVFAVLVAVHLALALSLDSL